MQEEKILIVEDNDEDYEAALRALKKAGFDYAIDRCVNGDEALDYLYKRNDYANHLKSEPSLVLLDLNMPGLDGRKVLEEIKSDKSLKKVPVVVLTTSSDDRDINSCYAFGANSYIQKPVDFDSFLEAIKNLKDYWFDLVVLPKRKLGAN